MSNSPRISMIVCTRDRAERLEAFFASFKPDEIQKVDAEVVLVDNGSRDATPGLLRAFASGAGFPVQVVQENQPGLSNARNAGMRAARGEWLVFTDDDCFLLPGYWATLESCLNRGDFDFFGGSVLNFDKTDSVWCTLSLRGRRIFPPGHFYEAGIIFGANMGFHRRVVEKVGGFDPLMGAGAKFRCEDIDYVARASRAGFRGALFAELGVAHNHGRKPGTPELRAQIAADCHAAGSYYMKRLLEGQWRALKGFFDRPVANGLQALQIYFRIYGAVHFFFAAMLNRRLLGPYPQIAVAGDKRC